MIKIINRITIDESELQIDYVQASGPGGQNVNKVATAVQLRFDVLRSNSLPDEAKIRIDQIQLIVKILKESAIENHKDLISMENKSAGYIEAANGLSKQYESLAIKYERDERIEKENAEESEEILAGIEDTSEKLSSKKDEKVSAKKDETPKKEKKEIKKKVKKKEEKTPKAPKGKKK